MTGLAAPARRRLRGLRLIAACPRCWVETRPPVGFHSHYRPRHRCRAITFVGRRCLNEATYPALRICGTHLRLRQTTAGQHDERSSDAA
jgi:hypothetical protein